MSRTTLWFARLGLQRLRGAQVVCETALAHVRVCVCVWAGNGQEFVLQVGELLLHRIELMYLCSLHT
jgi:hypothetical protein